MGEDEGVRVSATDFDSGRKLTAEFDSESYSESSLEVFRGLYQKTSLGQFIAEHCAAAMDHAMTCHALDDAQQEDFDGVILASIAAVQALGLADCVRWRRKIQQARKFLVDN
jgi:hypothetical protein